jgi:hypothetical protein
MFYRRNLPAWERAARVLRGAAMVACGFLGLPGLPVPDHRNPSGDRNDWIFRILPDVRMQETLWPLTTGYIV